MDGPQGKKNKNSIYSNCIVFFFTTETTGSVIAGSSLSQASRDKASGVNKVRGRLSEIIHVVMLTPHY